MADYCKGQSRKGRLASIRQHSMTPPVGQRNGLTANNCFNKIPPRIDSNGPDNFSRNPPVPVSPNGSTGICNELIGQFASRSARVTRREIDHQVVLLHSGKQCQQCGMRFNVQRDTKELDSHLDWHFKENRRKKQCRSTGWYVSKDEWVSGTNSTAANKTKVFDTVKNEVKKVVSVAPKKHEDKCTICNEKFEFFFHQEEEWHAKDAVYTSEMIHHRGRI